MANNVLALTMGDPRGVGPLISGRAWEALRFVEGMAFCLIGDIGVMQAVSDIALTEIGAVEEAGAVFSEALPILSRPAAGGAAIAAWIEEAAELALSGRVAAIVTNPIDKAAMQAHGFAGAGHTEFLASLATRSGYHAEPVMMLVGGGLKVALATIHIPLAAVPAALDKDKLIRIGHCVDKALRVNFGQTVPRLAFAGLNPHAGESGLFGSEEQELINPAAQALRDRGVDISDALSADSVFHLARAGQFDAVIAMYHDQGLIPVKTLDFHGGVNMTLGLPFIRTSPDHGTAVDAAARGEADPHSLIAALELASILSASPI